MDEAQEDHEGVLNELQLLSSVELDSKNILAVVFAGDNRLPEKLRAPMLMPLESRIRIRQHLDKRPPQEETNENMFFRVFKETTKKRKSSR